MIVVRTGSSVEKPFERAVQTGIAASHNKQSQLMASRGHEVAFIGIPDIEPVVRAADLDFVPFCENEFPPGSVAKRWGAVANLEGLDVVRYTALELTPPLVRAALEHLPRKIAQTGVNALVIDSVYRLEIVPMHLRRP